MGLDLFAQLRRHAEQRGCEDALRVIGPMAGAHPPVSWAALCEQTFAASAWLDTHLPADAVVMLLSPNRPRVVPAFLGLLAAGHTVFPVDAALTLHEIQDLIERADVSAVIVDESLRAKVKNLATRTISLATLIDGSPRAHDTPPLDRSDDAWLLLQSSGTTGGPKIVRRSGPSLDAVARNVAESVGLRTDDRVVAAIPLSHSYGIENGMLGPIFAGACALHHVAESEQPGRGFDPTLAVTSGATVLPGVPAMFEMIDARGAGQGALRLAYSAGAPLPQALAQRLEGRDGLRLGQLYGCTEIGSVTFDRHPGSVGQPMPGVNILVLHPDHPDPKLPMPTGKIGHVAVRAPSMFDRYLGPDSLTADSLIEGYFLTGDLGHVDAQGRLHITGRLKLLIDVGGVKVNPIEVEQVLAGHPHVAECVVVPDPVSPTINRVKAVLTAADPKIDPQELRSYLRQRLAAHKVPRTFEVRESLPKSPTGKILRQKLQVPT